MAEPTGLRPQDLRERVSRVFRYAQAGRCVSSIAHDANNLLGAALAGIDLLELTATFDDKTRGVVGQIGEALEGASALLSNLTSVVRKEEVERGRIDVAEFIKGALALKRHECRTARVALESDAGPEAGSLDIDRPRLVMAVVYLVTNALEAMEDADDRHIRVRACRSEGGVEIEVWNSGPVIPETIRERIFEPFYSTKAGDHLGLGLTLAREAARAHAGELRYEPNRGFVFRLPQATPATP